MSTGAERIAIERQRQITAEGWTPEHDREHDNEELVQAAVAYLLREKARWPWHPMYLKPSPNRVRELVKAGALIAAEIDRLLPTEEGKSS